MKSAYKKEQHAPNPMHVAAAKGEVTCVCATSMMTKLLGKESKATG